ILPAFLDQLADAAGILAIEGFDECGREIVALRKINKHRHPRERLEKRPMPADRDDQQPAEQHLMKTLPHRLRTLPDARRLSTAAVPGGISEFRIYRCLNLECSG